MEQGRIGKHWSLMEIFSSNNTIAEEIQSKKRTTCLNAHKKVLKVFWKKSFLVFGKYSVLYTPTTAEHMSAVTI